MLFVLEEYHIQYALPAMHTQVTFTTVYSSCIHSKEDFTNNHCFQTNTEFHCCALRETAPPEGAVLEGVSSPQSARGSVRYDARFHRCLYSSSNFSMATEILC